jgi:UDPglucose 6-dehydrogenase
MDDALAAGRAGGRLTFTTEPAPPPETEIALVCVPTPTGEDGLLDLAAVEATTARLVAALPQSATIVVRSTLPLHGPERLAALGSPGRRPALLVNPEYMREGRALADFRAPSRVTVGYLDPADRPAAERFAGLYAALGAPVIVADAASVVLMKLSSNVFLALKVAFANELARLADATGAEYDAVADGIGLDPRIGRSFLDAGPGFGGSCLPEQAEAIAVEADRRGLAAPLLASVARSNRVHQGELVATVERALPRGLGGARVAVLGLAFKAGTNDVRRSPGIALAALLRSRGATVVGYDPVANGPATRDDPELETAPSAADAASGADAVVVATEWPEFAALDWATLAAGMRGTVVFDTRRVLPAEAVRAAGLTYVALGRATPAS